MFSIKTKAKLYPTVLPPLPVGGANISDALWTPSSLAAFQTVALFPLQYDMNIRMYGYQLHFSINNTQRPNGRPW